MKNMDKKTKRTIILGGLGLIFAIVLIIVMTIKSKSVYLIINDRGLQYQNGEWANISLTSPIFGKYRFRVYSKNEYKGTYEMNYVNEQWYFFDKKYDSHKIEPGSLLAYNGDVKVKKFEVDENLTDEDLQNIDKALQKENLSLSNYRDLFQTKKVIYDFDNDSKLETVYSVNYIEEDENNQENPVFSLLLYHDEQKDYTMKLLNSRVEYQDDLELFGFNNIIQIGKSNKNYLILSGSKNLNVNSTYNIVYSFTKGKPKLEKEYTEEEIDVKLTEKDYFGTAVLLIILAVVCIAGGTYYYIRRKKKDVNEL